MCHCGRRLKGHDVKIETLTKENAAWQGHLRCHWCGESRDSLARVTETDDAEVNPSHVCLPCLIAAQSQVLSDLMKDEEDDG